MPFLPEPARRAGAAFRPRPLPQDRSLEMNTINFARGVPDPRSFPSAQLEAMAALALKKDPAGMLQYGPSAGYGPLREYIGSWLGCRPAEVLIGNGSLELFGFICEAYLEPGDTVFVESPTYDRAITTLRKHDVDIVGIGIGHRGIDLEAFERALEERRPKLVYLIPDFQNPTGVCMDLAARRRIVEWSREKDFLIVEDNPYTFLRYHGEDIPTIYSMAPDRCLHLSSFTKLISPGIRVGFMLGDRESVRNVSGVAESYYITPGYFSQGVVAEWCAAGYLQLQLEELRNLYRPRLDNCIRAITRHLPGTLIGQPEGGFFASLRLDVRVDERTLVRKAEAEGIILSSGDSFFATPPGFRFIRLPFCALSPSEFTRGVERLAGVIHSLELRLGEPMEFSPFLHPVPRSGTGG